MLAGEVLRKRYKIVNLLGSGGFGDTYLTQDLDLPSQPSCVVKHLKPKNSDPAVLAIARCLFDSEAQILYRLGDGNNQIPRLFAHFEENGEFYLVQEFIEGHDLSQEIAVGKRLSENEVTQLLQEILAVLAVVHRQHVIHRDIKPQNIMRRRKDGKIVLIDFGAVKEINTLVSIQGQASRTVTIGTQGYMPCEQANGQPRLCSDVYAVGMLGIQALTGILPHQLPQDPTNGEVIWRNWSNVSGKLADVLTKMVRYNFGQRYHTAAEALQALNSIASPTPPTKPFPAPQSTIPSPAPQPTITSPAPQPTITSPALPIWSRRQVIQTVGFVGTGFGLAILGQRLFQSGSGDPSPDQPNGTATLPVRESPATQSPTSEGATASGKLRLQTFQFQVVTVNEQGNITNRRPGRANFFVEDLGNGITLEMVEIPGGTFTMGSPETEPQRETNEGPQHQVTIAPFFLGKYEVTQAQYQAVMGSNPSGFTTNGANRPVEQVSWHNAVEFCSRLSQRTGRTYRLPSEAEWEYACRAGTTTPFYSGETITTALANYKGNNTYRSEPKGEYRRQTTTVDSFPPNAFGLYDMHGNVWEWCADPLHDNYQGAPTDGRVWNNDNDNQRLLRGGSWDTNPRQCRSAARVGDAPNTRYDDFGFRVVAVRA